MLHEFPIETSLNKKDFAQKQTWYQQTYQKFDSRLSKITAKLKDQVSKILIFIEQGW